MRGCIVGVEDMAVLNSLERHAIYINGRREVEICKFMNYG